MNTKLNAHSMSLEHARYHNHTFTAAGQWVYNTCSNPANKLVVRNLDFADSDCVALIASCLERGWNWQSVTSSPILCSVLLFCVDVNLSRVGLGFILFTFWVLIYLHFSYFHLSVWFWNFFKKIKLINTIFMYIIYLIILKFWK